MYLFWKAINIWKRCFDPIFIRLNHVCLRGVFSREKTGRFPFGLVYFFFLFLFSISRCFLYLHIPDVRVSRHQEFLDLLLRNVNRIFLVHCNKHFKLSWFKKFGKLTKCHMNNNTTKLFLVCYLIFDKTKAEHGQQCVNTTKRMVGIRPFHTFRQVIERGIVCWYFWSSDYHALQNI